MLSDEAPLPGEFHMNINSLKDAARTVANIHIRGSLPDIAVFATPRGGSTWFMELLATQPWVKFYDEPFNIRRRNVKKTGLFSDWADIMPDTANRKQLTDYLEDLRTGKYGFMNPAPFRRNYRPFTRRIVFKLHAIEFMAEELRRRGYLVVCLLRHPIPTTLSRTVYPRLDYFLRSRYYAEKYFDPDTHRKIVDRAERGSKLERGVISWCFENIDLLAGQGSSRFLCVTYEELVCNAAAVTRKLGTDLALPNVGVMEEYSSRPSVNIALSGETTNQAIFAREELNRQRYLIMRWKKRVSEMEEQDAMSVLQDFGIDAYNTNSCFPADRYLLAHDETRKYFEHIAASIS